MLPGAFPDKFTPDIDFIDEAVVQYYDVPVVKTGPYVVFLDPVLCIVLVS